MKALRILLITELSRPWNNGWYYKTGLEKNGHTVILFDPSSSENPLIKVRAVVKESRPDFILHTKVELPAEIFQELRQFAPVIMWYPDPVIPDWLPPYVKASDIFFTMAEGLVVEFRKLNENVFWLSQAFEPSFFEVTDISSRDRKMFAADVTFVGNLGSKKQYIARRVSLERVMKEGFTLKWWGPRIPRKFSTIPLMFGMIGRAYGGKFIWGQDYARVARLSKIFLAFDSMPHIKKSMSARMYTAVGCGAFYMCQHVSGIEDVLMPGREIVTFHSDDEMIDMIRYYLKRDEERRRISEAGRSRVLTDHTYEVRTGQMMEIVLKNL